MKYKILDLTLLAIVVAACIFCSQIYPDPRQLEWTRYAWSDLYFWVSFLTGNFTHFTMQHLGENIAGLLLIWLLFYSQSVDDWFDKTLSLLVSALAVTIGIYFFAPHILVYAGLSGALHGMFAYAALLRWIKDGSFLGFLFLAGLAAKLYVDFFYPDLTFTEITKNLYGEYAHLTFLIDPDKDFQYKVCGEAHLYGSIAGAVLAAIRYLCSSSRPKTQFSSGGIEA